MRILGIMVAGLVAAGLAYTAPVREKGAKNVPAALDFRMKSLDDKEVDLSTYKGKVVLLVNVASKCGYTPQYKGLEALHEKYAKDGLVIIGIPSNNFGGQEPGSNEEIATFCHQNYDVQFPMLAKVDVNGENQVPLYRFLTSKETDPRFAGPIRWNFTKFLIGRNGDVVARFESPVKPESADMTQAIEAELAKK